MILYICTFNWENDTIHITILYRTPNFEKLDGFNASKNLQTTNQNIKIDPNNGIRRTMKPKKTTWKKSRK